MRPEIAKKSILCALWAALRSTFVLTYDTTNFTELVLETPDHFVDKSLLIKALLEDKHAIISILRPRLWGKTLNLDMVRLFLQIEVDSEGIILPRSKQKNRKYFAGFEIKHKPENVVPKVKGVNLPVDIRDVTRPKVYISPVRFPARIYMDMPVKVTKIPALKIFNVSEAMQHQGIYPVIWLDFEYSKFSTYSDMENYLKNLVKVVFSEYPYLLNYTTDEGEKNRLRRYLAENITSEEFSDSIRFLSELLYKHFNRKVYVLVNDHLNPFNLHAIHPKSESIEYEKIVNLLKNLFCNTFNNNPYIKKGIFTGTIPSSEAYSSVFRHLNNFTEYTVLDDEFSEFYGFSRSEVDNLVKYVPPEFVRVDPLTIVNLYEGYNHGREIVYNPTSVIGHLQLGGHRIPWLQRNTLPHQCIDSQLSNENHQQAIRDLVYGYGIVSTIEPGISYQNCTEVALYSALLFAGYLSPTAVDKSNRIYRLTIPNNEIKEFYVKKIENWVKDKLSVDVVGASDFMKMLPACAVGVFQAAFQKFISDLTDKFHKFEAIEREVIIHDLMLILIDTLSPNYRINYQKFSSTNETVATLVPTVEHFHNVIFIGYRVIEDGNDSTSAANSTLQNVNSLKFNPETVCCAEIENIIRIGISICKWHTVILHNVESIS